MFKLNHTSFLGLKKSFIHASLVVTHQTQFFNCPYNKIRTELGESVLIPAHTTPIGKINSEHFHLQFTLQPTEHSGRHVGLRSPLQKITSGPAEVFCGQFSWN